MSRATIYHYPQCSKSRATLALLQQNGIQPEVVLYLQTPPDIATLKTLLKQLGFHSARQLMRNKEACYKELALDDLNLSEEKLLTAMVENPILIERPVVIANDQAKLGRPPEQVLELF